MRAESGNFEQDIFLWFTNALKHNSHQHNIQVHSNILLRSMQLHYLPGSMQWFLTENLACCKKTKNQASSFYFKKLNKVDHGTAYKERHLQNPYYFPDHERSFPFNYETFIRGYHVYMNVWSPLLAQSLFGKRNQVTELTRMRSLWYI